MKCKAVLVSMIATTMIFSGCSKEDSKEKLVVGMECNYAPFNWQISKPSGTSIDLDGAGFADGYDIRIASYLGEELDREVDIKKIAWDGLIPAVNTGDIDVIIAGMTPRKGLDFTKPYYDSEMVMIVRKSDDEAKNAKSIQDFSGKKVVGQKNTNYDYIIDQIEGVEHAVPKNNYPEMIVALQKYDVDAITAEYPVALGVVGANNDLAIVRFDSGQGFDMDTSVAVGMKEGSKDSELFQQIEAALDRLSNEVRQQWMEDAVSTQPKVQ